MPPEAQVQNLHVATSVHILLASATAKLNTNSGESTPPMPSQPTVETQNGCQGKAGGPVILAFFGLVSREMSADSCSPSLIRWSYFYINPEKTLPSLVKLKLLQIQEGEIAHHNGLLKPEPDLELRCGRNQRIKKKAPSLSTQGWEHTPLQAGGLHVTVNALRPCDPFLPAVGAGVTAPNM